MPELSLDAGERNAVVRFISGVLSPVVARMVRETWSGEEHIPRTGGVVVAANHLSHVDPLVIGRFFIVGCGRWPHFLGKAEVFRFAPVAALLHRAGQIPVQRGSDLAGESVTEAVDGVTAGRLVCILPEGTFTREPRQWPMAGRTGAARVALTAGCDLVPAAVWGTHDMLPPRAGVRGWLRMLTRRHDVVAVAGPPVDLDDLRSRPIDAAVLTEATERLMRAVTLLVADVRQEDPPAEVMPNPRVRSRVRTTTHGRETRRRGDRS